jgi:hypothetical protein
MCEPYNARQMADLLFAIRMEVMNGDKHEANRMLLSLSSVIHDEQNEEE